VVIAPQSSFPEDTVACILERQRDESNCRIVKHAMGETCVPTKPQRVVTLDVVTLEDVLALGIKPIGTVTCVDWSHLQNKLEGVENIGVGEPNLEKVLALKPD